MPRDDFPTEAAPQLDGRKEVSSWEEGLLPLETEAPSPGEGFASPKEVRRVFSRIGMGLFVMIALHQLVALLLIWLTSLYAPHILEQGWAVWVFSYVPLYLIAFPVMLLIWKTIPDREGYPSPKAPLSARIYFQLVSISLVLVLALHKASELLANLFALMKGAEVVNPLEAAIEAGSVWANFVVIVLIAPVMEELIFRGLLYKKLSCFGDKVYILISGLLFAAMHVNLFQMLYAFVLGAMFAAVVCKTGSIRSAVILHMCVNFLGGGGTPLLAYYLDDAIWVWGMVLLALMAVGLISMIRLLIRRPKLQLTPARYPIAQSRSIFLNTGMLAYLVLVLAMTIYTIFA